MPAALDPLPQCGGRDIDGTVPRSCLLVEVVEDASRTNQFLLGGYPENAALPASRLAPRSGDGKISIPRCWCRSETRGTRPGFPSVPASRVRSGRRRRGRCRCSSSGWSQSRTWSRSSRCFPTRWRAGWTRTGRSIRWSEPRTSRPPGRSASGRRRCNWSRWRRSSGTSPDGSYEPWAD